MQKWEYSMRYASIEAEAKEGTGLLKSVVAKASHLGLPAPWLLWDTSKEKSEFQAISELGKQGWEMVSAIPIESTYLEISYTRYILFIFRRPLED